MLRTYGSAAGFAQVPETYDPGWSATVDEMPVPVTPAHRPAQVAVPAGPHTVRLRYHTPGRVTGAALSAVSLAGLVSLIASGWRRT